jgi:hypothetical protein
MKTMKLRRQKNPPRARKRKMMIGLDAVLLPHGGAVVAEWPAAPFLVARFPVAPGGIVFVVGMKMLTTMTLLRVGVLRWHDAVGHRLVLPGADDSIVTTPTTMMTRKTATTMIALHFAEGARKVGSGADRLPSGCSVVDDPVWDPWLVVRRGVEVLVDPHTAPWHAAHLAV